MSYMISPQRISPLQRWIAEEAPSTGHMPFLRTHETIFSWLSRYAEPFHPQRSGVPLRGAKSASKAILKALYGARVLTLLEDFPRGLGVLAAQVPGHCWSCNELVEGHTALPYYSRFLSPAQYAALRTSMVDGVKYAGRKGVMQQAGGQARASTLAYCEECVAADLLDGKGSPSWRRLHQLPGMFVCSEHGVTLKLSNVPVSHNRQLVCCPGTVAGQHRPPPFAPALALQLAEDTRWLLENPGPQRGAAAFKGAMHDLLQSLGLKRGSMVSPELRSVVDRTFGSSGLEAMGLPCQSPEGKWCRTLLCHSGAERPGAPLQWLVLLAAFGVRIRDFVPMVEEAAARQLKGSSSRQMAIAAKQPRRSIGKRPRRADEEVVAALQAALQRTLEDPGWPPRATAARLLRLAGIKHSKSALLRIHPLAAAALATLVDSEQDIFVRRLLFLGRRALQDGRCPNFTTFVLNTYPGMHPKRDVFRAMARGIYEALVEAMATVPASMAGSVFECLAAAAVARHAGPPDPACESEQSQEPPDGGD